MSSNRQQLRARMRILLNDPDADKWSDDVLNELLRQHLADWREKFFTLNPDQYADAGQISITANTPRTAADYNAATQPLMTKVDFRFIDEIRDVTQGQHTTVPGVSWDGTGFLLKKAKTMKELKSILDRTPTALFATHWYLYRVTTFDDTVGADYGKEVAVSYLMLAPVPTSARELNLIVRGNRPDSEDYSFLSSDTCETGLPHYAERPYLLQCVIDARMMEQNPNTRLLERQFERANRDFRTTAKKTLSPDDDEMEYDASIID